MTLGAGALTRRRAEPKPCSRLALTASSHDLIDDPADESLRATHRDHSSTLGDGAAPRDGDEGRSTWAQEGRGVERRDQSVQSGRGFWTARQQRGGDILGKRDTELADAKGDKVLK